MSHESASIGDLQLILERCPALGDGEVVVPLEGLSFLLLARSLYPTTLQATVWRKEVELYLRTLLLPDFQWGESLASVLEKADAQYQRLAFYVLQNSLLRQYGFYGSSLRDETKIAALKELRTEAVVRSAEAKFAGATSLAQTLKPLRGGGNRPPVLDDEQLKSAVLYPTDTEALNVGELLTHLCRLARYGVPDALHSFEKKRDVKGVVWDCFEGVYTRASVKVDRKLLHAMLRAFEQRTLRLDHVIFLPLYQLVYSRDKSLPALHLSVGSWLNMFGAQGSETSYRTHIYSRHIEREGQGRHYFLGEEHPFFLTHLGVDQHKYEGIYLCYGEKGCFPIGENSFHPGNFPARAFVLGEELRGLERIFYPSLSPKFRGRAFNQLVCPNPITKSKLKPSTAKLSSEFTALIGGVEESQGKCSETLMQLAFDAARAWADERDKNYLFLDFTDFAAIQGQLDHGSQLPKHLKAPLEPVETGNSRQAWNQKHTPQKAVDTVLNILSQTALCKINSKLGGIFSGYLPATSPLNVAGELLQATRHEQIRLMNVDVAKAFDSIDLVTYEKEYDLWLLRCDQVARDLCPAWQADLLKNIFQTFASRVREGFYAGGGVERGKTPLGLSLGPSFWVYLSLPLAKSLYEAKAEGDCLFATITGDDTLAVLKESADTAKLWQIFQDFSKLGFQYHFFKNFDLNFEAKHPITHDGAFSSLWSRDVPILHAGVMVHRQLIYATSRLSNLTVADLTKQSRYGLVRFPTNVLRIVHYKDKTGSSDPSSQLSNYDTMSLNSVDVLLDKLPRAERIRALEPTTHGGLLYFNKGRLLEQILGTDDEQAQSQDSSSCENAQDLRAKAALAYHEFFKKTVKQGNVESEALAKGLREELLKAFPQVKQAKKEDVQPMFGDCEAVALQLLMDVDPNFRFRSNHGRKIRIAVGRTKCHDYNHNSYYSKTLVVPLTRLALEFPDLIFTKRQRSLALEGVTLGPRFSIKREEKTFRRSGQALEVLATKGEDIRSPSVNQEILKALATMTRANLDWTSTRSPEYLQRKSLELFESLPSADKICFRKLLRGHLRRCRTGEKTFRQELKVALGGKDKAWETVHEAWKTNDLVRLLLKS